MEFQQKLVRCYVSGPKTTVSCTEKFEIQLILLTKILKSKRNVDTKDVARNLTQFNQQLMKLLEVQLSLKSLIRKDKIGSSKSFVLNLVQSFNTYILQKPTRPHFFHSTPPNPSAFVYRHHNLTQPNKTQLNPTHPNLIQPNLTAFIYRYHNHTKPNPSFSP